MIYFLKGHPINQAVTCTIKEDSLNEGELRRNPGEPSQLQAESGDYNKPVMKWRGLTIRIESPVGSVRRGPGWHTRMKYDYGYVSGSNGVDRDEIEVYIGPHINDAEMVYVVHQRKYGQWSKYDEDKCMLGFLSEDDAKAAYLAHYDDPRFLGPVTALAVGEFVSKVKATREKPAMIKSVVLFLKSNVKGHTRRTASGKVVYVNPYANKVASKRQDNSDKQLSLFADNDYVEPKQADDNPEAKLRALWTKQGVSKEKQDELIAQVGDKAKPGAQVGPFAVGDDKAKGDPGTNATSKEEKKKIHQYGLRYRPAGLSNVPAGFHSEKDHPSFRHGVISYDRPLSDDEIKTFELTPIVDIREHARKIIEKMGRYASKYGENQKALEDFVNKNARVGLWSTDDIAEITSAVARQIPETLLRQSDISVQEYFSSVGVDGDDFHIMDAVNAAKKKTGYGRLIDDIVSEIGKLKSTPERRMAIDLLNGELSRNYEHPFNNKYVTKMPPGIQQKFKRRADETSTGDKARQEQLEAEHKEIIESAIQHANKVKSQQALSDGPKEGDRNAEGLVFRDGRWHRDEDELTPLDKLRAKVAELGGKEKIARMFMQNKAQGDKLIDKFVNDHGLPREVVLAEFGLKIKGESKPKTNVERTTERSELADEDNPNSPNYRYRDTGYVAGSRKEQAANAIKQAAKAGRRVNMSDVDWESIEENPREAKELIVKSNLFGEVAWDRLREEGMEPGAGFLIDRVYASIGTGPSEDSPQARKDYALGLQSLRGRMEACKAAGEVVKVIDEIKEETHGKMLLEGDAEKYQSLSGLRLDIHKKIRPMEELNDKLYQASIAANSEKYKVEHEIRNRENRKWKVSDELREKLAEKKAATEAAHSAWLEKLNESRPVIEKLKELLRTALTEMRNIENQAIERNARENPLTRAWATLGERFNAVINFRSSGFHYGDKRVSGSDAFRKHVVAAKNNRITDWSWAETKGEHKAPTIKQESVRFQLKVADKYERVGGRAVKPESTIELKNQFNLREVQSGNWVLRDAVSAKFHVENTAAAFADLADIVGVPDKDVSLNGRLAMAFGARGSGAKGWKDAAPRAHYEPVHRIINLTKMGGGGTLAHEWAHALDNIISEAVTGKAGDTSDYVTERPDLLPAGELRDAFMAVRSAMLDGNERGSQTLKYSGKDIGMADYNINRQFPNEIAKKIKAAGNAEMAVQAVDDHFKDHRMTPKTKKQINDWRRVAAAYHDRNPDGNELKVKAGPTMSRFAVEAAILDDGKNSYWSTPHEMFARAFQSYVEDTLASLGRKNDYLSVYADNKYHVDPLLGIQWKPYPEGEERERINITIEKLLAAVRKHDVLAKAAAMFD